MNAELMDVLRESRPSAGVTWYVDHIRAWTRRKGIPMAPVGCTNLKTAGPSTHRPVMGETSCPSTCPLRQGEKSICYGGFGRLRMIDSRATLDLEANLNAVAVAIHAAARHGLAARLHVIGDFCAHDKLDVPYILGVMEIAADARKRWKRRWVAWSYEHLGPELREEFEPWRAALKAFGVVVRKSDYLGYGGAVVLPYSRFKQVKAASGKALFKCPAMCVKDHSITCQTCRLCWEREDLCVAFDVHASHKEEVARRTENVYARWLTPE